MAKPGEPRLNLVEAGGKELGIGRRWPTLGSNAAVSRLIKLFEVNQLPVNGDYTPWFRESVLVHDDSAEF